MVTRMIGCMSPIGQTDVLYSRMLRGKEMRFNYHNYCIELNAFYRFLLVELYLTVFLTSYSSCQFKYVENTLLRMAPNI